VVDAAPGSDDEKRDDPSGSHSGTYRRLARDVHWRFAIVGVVGMIVVIMAGAALTGRRLVPITYAGTARLFVPVTQVDGSANFQLSLVLAGPGSRLVQYSVTAGCGTRATKAILMLSGGARIDRPQTFLSAGLTVRSSTTTVAEPWFTSGQQVQLFSFAIKREACPTGVKPADFGTATVIDGQLHRRLEDHSAQAHELQLPQIGDQSHTAAALPRVSGTWVGPPILHVVAGAGGLPIEDRVDVARPTLTGSGSLSWKSTD
jgi:hypothetical protein